MRGLCNTLAFFFPFRNAIPGKKAPFWHCVDIYLGTQSEGALYLKLHFIGVSKNKKEKKKKKKKKKKQ